MMKYRPGIFYKLFPTVLCALMSIDCSAGPMANVQYVHDIILSRQRIDLPMNSLTNPMAGANMKYLLTAIDRANDLNPCATTPTDYGNSSYATQYAADTTTVDKAVSTLIKSTYVEVEYIANEHGVDSYDAPYIDTGLTLATDIQFTATLAYVGTNLNSIFGGRLIIGKNSFLLQMENGVFRYYLARQNPAGATGSWVKVGKTKQQGQKTTVTLNKRKIFIDNDWYAVYPSGKSGDLADDSNIKLHLFHTFDLANPTNTLYTLQGKMYLARIWSDPANSGQYDDSTLLRDFVPVKRLDDGKCGMLDLVDKKFYPSINVLDFTCGPEMFKYYCIP